MEEHGIILKYTAVVDMQHMGIKKITAIVTVFADPKEMGNLARKISDLQVSEVSTSLSEEQMVIAKVFAEDPSSLHVFIAQSVGSCRGC